jgi:hypothetical protein
MTDQIEYQQAKTMYLGMQTGVNVTITIVGEFHQLSAKKSATFVKTNFKIIFIHKF